LKENFCHEKFSSFTVVTFDIERLTFYSVCPAFHFISRHHIIQQTACTITRRCDA